MPLATWAFTLLLSALPDAPPPSPAAPALAVASAQPETMKDPKALALLRKMSDRLGGARIFTFKARTSREVLLGNGVHATFFNDVRVAVKRPDKLAATRTGTLPELRFAYDGVAMTASVPGKGLWTTAPAPPTIEAMLVAAFEQAGLSFPADEVLVADPFAAVTKDLTSASWIGQSILAGRKADHIVLASPGLELQYWLDVKTGLPVASAVVYVDDPSKPHFYIEYLEWRLDAKLPASTFALPKPSGVTQVEFRAVGGAAQ